MTPNRRDPETGQPECELRPGPDAHTRPLAERWANAVHEAAHLTVAAALGVKPVAAYLYDGDAGAQAVHEPCSDYETAFIAAAGLAAGDVLAWLPDPPPLTQNCTSTSAAPAPPNAPGLLPVVTAPTHALGRHDIAVVRRWATATDDWELWSTRAGMLTARARRVCELNARLLFTLATKLYWRGRLDRQDLKGITGDSDE